VQPWKGVFLNAQIVVEHGYRGGPPCYGCVNPSLPPALNVWRIKIIDNDAAARQYDVGLGPKENDMFAR